MKPTIEQKLEYLQKMLKDAAREILKAMNGLERIQDEIAERGK